MAFTLNKAIDIFRDISENHQMIHSFGFGPDYNMVNIVEKKFPYLYLEPDTNRIILDNSIMIGEYSFNVYVMDKINKGDSNYDDILSDTDLILNGVIAIFLGCELFRENSISLVGNVSKTPAHEETDDNVNGWIASFTLRTPLGFSSCEMPLDSECE